MAKKIILGVFTGILALGVIIMIIGFAMGGSLGSISTHDGQLIYRTFGGGQVYELGESKFADRIMDSTDKWVNRWNRWDRYDGRYYEYDYGDESHYSYDDWAKDTTLFSDLEEYRYLVPTFPTGGTELDLPIEAGDKLSIKIDFGYVRIVEGKEPGVVVSGPLNATVKQDGDEYKVRARYDYNGVTTRAVDGFTHFFHKGQDITTFYTITIPEKLAGLEAELDMGTLQADDLRADEIDLSISLGMLNTDGITAERLDLSVELGMLTATNAKADNAELDVSMGNLVFKGDVADWLDTHCSMGNLEIVLPRGEYGYEVDNELGNVNIDGKSFSPFTNGNPSRSNPTADVFLQVSCEMGNITISFE